MEERQRARCQLRWMDAQWARDKNHWHGRTSGQMLQKERTHRRVTTAARIESSHDQGSRALESAHYYQRGLSIQCSSQMLLRVSHNLDPRNTQYKKGTSSLASSYKPTPEDNRTWSNSEGTFRHTPNQELQWCESEPTPKIYPTAIVTSVDCAGEI